MRSKKVFKNFIFFFTIIALMEFVFGLIMFKSYLRESIINILLHTVSISSFLAIITQIFPEKANRVITAIVLFIIGFFFSLQKVFYSIMTTFFTFSILGLSNQLNDFKSEAISLIFGNILYILLFMLPFILYLIFKKKINLRRNKLANYVVFLIILILSIISFNIHVSMTKKDSNGSYALLHKVNNIDLSISRFGVLKTVEIDLQRTLFGFDEKLDNITTDVEEKKEEKEEEKVIKYEGNVEELNFDKETSNKEIQTINEYMKNTQYTDQNEYTGMFKGYNIVYITAESFSEIGISEELTPTLYKLTHTGFIFDNYYTPNVLSTIGGEFQSLTGLFPDKSILDKWRSGTNYFPYGLATSFGNIGYKTYAYHNNSFTFQDRHKYIATQGFTNYKGCYNGMEKIMNCKKWPASDVEMIDVTMPDYINNEEPFLAYYMTVSGHFKYTWSDNSICSKNRQLVTGLDKATESAKAYVATQIELDRALEHLIAKLEEVGKLDKTVIVLMADHYPYALDLDSINSLSTFERDKTVGVNHNALIIWNSKLEDKHITKPCMTADVVPTVYNLFGNKYDSRLFIGRDILSTSGGLVIFNDRSWISDKGTYLTASGNFSSNETDLDPEYVNNMNNLVNTRLTISKYIIKNDYFKYLFDK